MFTLELIQPILIFTLICKIEFSRHKYANQSENQLLQIDGFLISFDSRISICCETSKKITWFYYQYAYESIAEWSNFA